MGPIFRLFSSSASCLLGDFVFIGFCFSFSFETLLGWGPSEQQKARLCVKSLLQSWGES